jgi:hypothetical protein
MWKAHPDNLFRLPEEEGNPLHSPDVSPTRPRDGLDTTLQVTSKNLDPHELVERLIVRRALP